MNSKIFKPNMVNVFIKDKNKYVLLIPNIGWEGNRDRWEMPGGKVERQDNNLEELSIKEAKQELDINIKLKKVRGTNIFGDYETQTPEGTFLCRTYFAEILESEPKIIEKKHDRFGYFDYRGLLKLKEQGSLVPNLIKALPDLKKYIA